MTPAALADLVRSVAHDVLTGRGLDPAALPATVTIQRSRDAQHGDYAINLALQTGERAGVPPRELAGWLAQELKLRRGVSSVEVAGPGFINLRLAADAQSDIVAQVLAAGPRFGALQDRPPPWWTGVEELPAVEAVQYAHARLAALARHAADLGFTHQGAQLELLAQEREGELIRMLGEFPRIVATGTAVAGTAVLAAQPNDSRRLVRYLEQVTSAYHRFEGSCRVLPMGDEEPSPLHAARLGLCQATRQVLANGLRLLGVNAPERM